MPALYKAFIKKKNQGHNVFNVLNSAALIVGGAGKVLFQLHQNSSREREAT